MPQSPKAISAKTKISARETMTRCVVSLIKYLSSVNVFKLKFFEPTPKMEPRSQQGSQRQFLFRNKLTPVVSYVYY